MGRLFQGGVVPVICCPSSLMLMVYFYAKKYDSPASRSDLGCRVPLLHVSILPS